jgi:tRNA A-37 threonylcarbamoyl transferase component Bud32
MNAQYIKPNVKEHEYELQKYVYDLNIVNVPRIYDYDKKTKVMKMEDLNVDNIAVMYDEYEEDLQNKDLDYLYDEIRNIILKLYQNNIIYVDITPYNFIETKNGVYIIDFEHAFRVEDSKEFLDENKYKIDDITYLYEFLFDGINNFNPGFR